MALMFRSVLQNSGGAAELIVTCASEFAGETISCSDGTTTLTKTCPSSSPYTVTFKIPNSGNWTISATVGGTTYTSDAITVSLDYTAELSFGFNWQTWVTAGGLDPTDYTDLADLLIDEKALRRLFLVHDAVDYMASSAAVNADLATVINTDLAAKWINLSDYALDTLYANTEIADEMDTADKYGYGEWVEQNIVPIMTSNTSPKGTAFASGGFNASTAYKAFDGNASDYPEPTGSSTQNNAVGYTFDAPTLIKKCSFTVQGSSGQSRTFKIQSSDDGFVSDINDIGEQTFTLNGSLQTFYVELTETSPKSSYRVFCAETLYIPTVFGCTINAFELMGYAPKGNVPVMTSNTAPYGEASASSVYSTYYAYNAFDGSPSTKWVAMGVDSATITYKFTNPICVTKFMYRGNIDSPYLLPTTIQLKGSNDGTNYTPIGSLISHSSADASEHIASVDNTTYYLYYQLDCKHRAYNSTAYVQLSQLQFYGRELKVSVPVMTSNTAPYGEVVSDTTPDQSYYLYNAFDNNPSTKTVFVSSAEATPRIAYKFTNPICVRAIKWRGNLDSPYLPPTTIQVVGSNDGVTWENIDSQITNIPADTNEHEQILSNDKCYLYIGAKCTNRQLSAVYWYTQFSSLQFYGLDYSEKEFEVGATKKWLYDHGVELETATLRTGSSGLGVCTKEDNGILLAINSGTNGNNSYACVAYTEDLTSYSLARAKNGEIYYGTSGSSATLTVCNSVDACLPQNGSYVGSDIIASSSVTTDMLPFNIALDISAVSGSKGVFYGNRYTTGYKSKLTELWLE